MMKTQIQESSAEWKNVHYRLELVLGLPAALPQKIYKFPHIERKIEQMKQKYHNKTVLDGLINLSNLQDTTINKIAQKKYKMSNLQIQTGHLQIQIDSKQTKRLWLLKAAVGDSYSIDSKMHQNNRIAVPSQFDSIYLQSSENQKFYQHKYILKQPDQYVLQYQIIYILDKTRQYNPKQLRCDKCKRSSADVYCKNQEVFLCKYCDMQHHKDSFFANHTKEQLTKFNTVDFCKQADHNKKLELYCEICQKAMCVQCTIHGWHSSKQFSSHQTKAIKKYYQQKAVENENQSNQRKHQLQKILQRIQDNIKQVEMCHSDLEAKINYICQVAIRQLEDETKNKLDQLIVIKIQTKRQYDQLIWTDSFIKYQQQILKPLKYLQSQRKYQEYKNQLLNVPLKKIPKINPNNLIVQGQIELIKTKQFSQKDHQKHSIKYQKQKSVTHTEKQKPKSLAGKSEEKSKSSRKQDQYFDAFDEDVDIKISDGKVLLPKTANFEKKISPSTNAPSILQSCINDANLHFIRVGLE